MDRENLGHGPWACDGVSLREVDAEVLQRAEGPFVLGAFGDRLLTEVPGEPHHCVDDVPAGRVVDHVPDELVIDLEEVDRQTFQVGEARVSRAEVI
ncbi:MAG: hypothetical protein QOF65_3010 [Thermoleophilaceae bacterium]|nr:hypothetical protein [Thermoleophilaceae bacterium]